MIAHLTALTAAIGAGALLAQALTYITSVLQHAIAALLGP